MADRRCSPRDLPSACCRQSIDGRRRERFFGIRHLTATSHVSLSVRMSVTESETLGDHHLLAHHLGRAEEHRGHCPCADGLAPGVLADVPVRLRHRGQDPRRHRPLRPGRLAANGNEYGWEAMDQLTRVTLGLQAWSRGQVYETAVDFFANHLNVANHSDGVWTTRHTMDRDVIRRHALGSYVNLLLASARNPAMLRYLSLASSTKSAINENHGRELLELHTVGIGNYTEADVQNSARILT